jgi:hypothetical protein
VPETANSVHALTIRADGKDAAMFDLSDFCKAMAEAVFAWYQDNYAHPKIRSNISNLLSWRPNGVPPFLQGSPVVAIGT